ncbi:MAG: cyclic nucleotide-binding domain-containing protein [Oscillospiraceae bacterium]|nr:cyclic nucleotide-binding domain-containing protein [Oscillospiraceae bacterium]
MKKEAGEREMVLELIRRHGLMEYLDERHVSHIQVKRMKKGTILIRQGEEVPFLYLLLEGKTSVYQVRRNGKQILLNTCEEGSMLGEVELLCRRPAMDFVELTSDGLMLAIPMDYCRAELLKDPPFVLRAAHMLAENLYKVEVNTAINLSLELEDKVASYILSVEREGVFELDLKTLPATFGTTYRHLMRVLKKFREAGYIEAKDGKYRIVDRRSMMEREYEAYIL